MSSNARSSWPKRIWSRVADLGLQDTGSPARALEEMSMEEVEKLLIKKPYCASTATPARLPNRSA